MNIYFDHKTKVLTNNGFKGPYEFNPDDGLLIAHLDSTNTNRFSDLDYIRLSPLFDYYRADVIKGRYIDLVVAKNDTVGMKGILKAFDINSLMFRRQATNLRYGILNFRKNQLHDFYFFLGLWCTDGSINKDQNTLRIHQSKTKNYTEIKRCLDSLGLVYSESMNGFRITSLSAEELIPWLRHNFLRDNDVRKTYFLSLPNWLRHSPAEYLMCFLRGVILGDGRTRKNTHDIVTASYQFAEDLCEIAIYCGYVPSIHWRKLDKRFKNASQLYDVTIKTELSACTTNIGKSHITPYLNHTVSVPLWTPSNHVDELLFCVLRAGQIAII